MLRVSSRKLRHCGIPITTLLLLASVAVYGQSLGDVARENREKKVDAAETAPPKVITDADLTKDAQAPEEPGTSAKAQAAFPRKTGLGRATATSRVDPRTEQWRRQ